MKGLPWSSLRVVHHNHGHYISTCFWFTTLKEDHQYHNYYHHYPHVNVPDRGVFVVNGHFIFLFLETCFSFFPKL